MAPRTANQPRSSSSPARRHVDAPLSGEELAGYRLRVLLDRLHQPLGDDLAAVLAGARPHVHDPVGRAHHLLVVLDHEHGVAEVAQPLERADQLPVVALMEPDRRLVEDVEDADQLRADLRGEPQALRLSARERLRGPIELEVADSHVVEEGEPFAYLLQDPPPDQLLGLRHLELVDEPERCRDRHLRERVDRPVADRDREHLRLEPRAAALGARPEAHVLLDPVALLRRVGLLVAPLEVVHEPLEGHRVLPLSSHPVPVGDEDPVAVGAVEKTVLLLAGEIAPGRLERDLVALGDRLDDAVVEALAPDRPRHERALRDRQRRVRHEEVRIDLELRAEPGAARDRRRAAS